MSGRWILLTLAMIALSNLVVLWVVVTIPPDYFRNPEPSETGPPRPRRPFDRVILIGQNVLGAILIVLGALLSLPMIPGPGLVLALLGLMLVDFPGKHRLVRKLLAHRGTLPFINRLRRRFGRPPLVLTEDLPPQGGEPRADVGARPET